MLNIILKVVVSIFKMASKMEPVSVSILLQTGVNLINVLSVCEKCYQNYFLISNQVKQLHIIKMGTYSGNIHYIKIP